jgi:hypothetical protein
LPAPNEYQPDIFEYGTHIKGGADFGKSHSQRQFFGIKFEKSS